MRGRVSESVATDAQVGWQYTMFCANVAVDGFEDMSHLNQTDCFARIKGEPEGGCSNKSGLNLFLTG